MANPQLHIRIFIDGEEPLRREVELENHDSTYSIPQAIDLNVNPSSILKVMVYRKSRLGILRDHLIGQFSNRISQLVTVIERM